MTLNCYRNHAILKRDGGANPWGLGFAGLFHMTNDSGLFRSADDLAALGAVFEGWTWRHRDDLWVPLYESKLLNIFNHRSSTVTQKRSEGIESLTAARLDDPRQEVTGRYWVRVQDVAKSIPRSWSQEWLLGFGGIARAGDRRTLMPTVIPRAGAGNSFPVILSSHPRELPLLQALLSSLVADYILRQKMSGPNINYFLLKQLACPAPAALDVVPAWSNAPIASFVRSRVLELSYTSHRLAAYAADVLECLPGSSDPGLPFRWLPERRAQLRAELDAAALHLYGLTRPDAQHVLDSFDVLRRSEERDHGEFRTRRLVLREYDAMADAARTGVGYVSPLDPPAGQGPRHEERTA